MYVLRRLPVQRAITHGPGSFSAGAGHLTTATTMYREMGMTYWLEQAEAAMREPM